MSDPGTRSQKVKAASPHASPSYTSTQRWVAVAYGGASHALFGASVVTMFFSLHSGLSWGLGRFSGWWRLVANFLLLAQFAAVHSLLLADRGRRWMGGLAPFGSGVRFRPRFSLASPPCNFCSSSSFGRHPECSGRRRQDGAFMRWTLFMQHRGCCWPSPCMTRGWMCRWAAWDGVASGGMSHLLTSLSAALAHSAMSASPSIFRSHSSCGRHRSGRRITFTPRSYGRVTAWRPRC